MPKTIDQLIEVTSLTGTEELLLSQAGVTKKSLLSRIKTYLGMDNVSATEMGYLDGLSSNAQTQINSKMAKTGISGSIGDVIDINVDAGGVDGKAQMYVDVFKSELAYTASGDVNSFSVDVEGSKVTGPLYVNGVRVLPTATELNYVDGVTSNIQTQLGTKPLSSRTGGGGLTSWLQNNLTNNTISNFDPDGGSYLYMDVSSVYLKNNYTQGSASSQVLLDSSATTISGPSIIIQPTTTTRIGTVTNNSTFEADGTLKMNGTATTWRDINISLVPPAGQSSALPAVVAVNGDAYLSCYAFSGTNSTPDEISGSLEVDHSYKEGSDISFHVHWAPTTTAIGNVVWQLRYAWFNRDTTPAGATLQTNLVATTSGVAWQEQTASFTLDGTGKTMGSRLMFTLFRDPINAGDTYAANAATYDMGLHFESDTLGSREMLVK